MLRVAAARLPPRAIARVPPVGSSRGVAYLPLLAGAGKVLAGAGLKKVAVNTIVKKLGPQRILKDLHAANRSLHEAQPDVYTAQMFNRSHDGLRALERTLSSVNEQEQVVKAWAWFQGLEKDNPSLAQVLIKTYVESFTPVRWASALLVADKPSPLPKEGAPSQAPTSGDDALVGKLREAFPEELRNYHVVLVPKEGPES